MIWGRDSGSRRRPSRKPRPPDPRYRPVPGPLAQPYQQLDVEAYRTLEHLAEIGRRTRELADRLDGRMSNGPVMRRRLTEAAKQIDAAQGAVAEFRRLLRR